MIFCYQNDWATVLATFKPAGGGGGGSGTTTVAYMHTDHLGGTNAATNDHKDLIQIADYYPFGSPRVNKTYTDFTEKRKFTGHEYDSSTGLNYAGARYQNGTQGRFTSQDPVFQVVGVQTDAKKLDKYLSDPQGFNSYAYARNNPLRLIDEDGEWFKEFFTGRQSWNSFQLELGDVASQLSNDSKIWNKAIDHPYVGGAVVGVGSGIAAYGSASALTTLSWQYIGGFGTGCLAACNSVIQRAPSYAERGYRSFEAFKNSVGQADPTGQNLRQWHHIIEQNASNVARFGQQSIQNGKNIVNIPTQAHQQITGFYNSVLSSGMRVRDFVNAKDFQTQLQIGQKVLDNVVSGKAPGTGLSL